MKLFTCVIDNQCEERHRLVSLKHVVFMRSSATFILNFTTSATMRNLKVRIQSIYMYIELTMHSKIFVFTVLFGFVSLVPPIDFFVFNFCSNDFYWISWQRLLLIGWNAKYCPGKASWKSNVTSLRGTITHGRKPYECHSLTYVPN